MFHLSLRSDNIVCHRLRRCYCDRLVVFFYFLTADEVSGTNNTDPVDKRTERADLQGEEGLKALAPPPH